MSAQMLLAPSEFPRRVLLCVTGMTPQVVTETLYALSQTSGEEAFIPTEVRVISTVAGARQARLALLAPDRDMFGQLCRQYGLPPIAFDESHVDVIHSEDGTPLEDIRTPVDNMAAADYITRAVAELCRDDNCALHVSIAGGRKSMGFFLGYALSLFGRAQDRLSHVLVSEGFESHPDFFFIPKMPATLIDRNGRQMSTADAHIYLADIPLVTLRHGVPKALLDGAAGYRETVRHLQTSQSGGMLRLEWRKHALRWGEQRAVLGPLDFLVYAFLAWRRVQGLPHNGALSQNMFRFNAATRHELREFAVARFGEMSKVAVSLDNAFDRFGGIEHDLPPDDGWLQQRISHITRKLGKFDPIAQRILAVVRNDPEGTRGGWHYALGLAAEQIDLGNSDPQEGQ